MADFPFSQKHPTDGILHREYLCSTGRSGLPLGFCLKLQQLPHGHICPVLLTKAHQFFQRILWQ